MSDKWAERYRIVKTAFWWKLIVGDCGTLYGRFYSRNEAEHMAALLLREFRNGMFVGAERAEAVIADWKVRDEQYAAVVAERDALRRDAERYRWLRANARRIDFAGLSWTQGCELDGRIDAALGSAHEQ